MNKKTDIYKLDPETPDVNIIKHAAQKLKNGYLVAFPTETVYGLGADAYNANAVKKIFIAKERPASDPLIVHIYSIKQLDDIVIEFSDIANKLAEKLWPGPLTMIFKKSDLIPYEVSSNLDTVAIRMPDNIISLLLLKYADIPVAAPSANSFSKPSPTSANHVINDLFGKIDIILDGGDSKIGIESTVIDMTKKTPEILRPGGIKLEQLIELIPDIKIKQKYFHKSNNNMMSPGMLTKHYSPDAELILYSGNDDKKILNRMINDAESIIKQGLKLGIMAANEDFIVFRNIIKEAFIFDLGSISNMEQIAANLFKGLRELDSKNVDKIIIKTLKTNGIGFAVNDRLIRASEGKIIYVS